MADKDLSEQFDKVAETAKAAAEKVKAGGARTREQLEADAAAARDKASEEADRLKDKAAEAHEKGSSRLQEVQEKWHEHATNVRKSMKHKQEELDAKQAASDADMAEAFALDAIALAGIVIEDAAAASLDAMYLRAAARASAAKAGP
jgi:hypothetical protein